MKNILRALPIFTFCILFTLMASAQTRPITPLVRQPLPSSLGRPLIAKPISPLLDSLLKPRLQNPFETSAFRRATQIAAQNYENLRQQRIKQLQILSNQPVVSFKSAVVPPLPSLSEQIKQQTIYQTRLQTIMDLNRIRAARNYEIPKPLLETPKLVLQPPTSKTPLSGLLNMQLDSLKLNLEKPVIATQANVTLQPVSSLKVVGVLDNGIVILTDANNNVLTLPLKEVEKLQQNGGRAAAPQKDAQQRPRVIVTKTFQ
jgi:hypothetical protein